MRKLTTILLMSLLGSPTFSFTVPLSPPSLKRPLRASPTDLSAAAASGGGGTFRPFVEHAWAKLDGLLASNDDLLVPSELASNEAAARGMPEGSVVRISVGAKLGSKERGSVKYGRYALLETLLPQQREQDAALVSNTKGIQVMNLVVFSKPPLPVWGVDLVSLPGDKHLLAMDVQPMVEGAALPLESKWKEWHETYVKDNFEWGGDLPEAAKKFFSPYGLWTRLTGDGSAELIQTKVFEAFAAHLDLYLECVDLPPQPSEENHQAEYLEYRLKNDPARPMLKSLYGPEWTERVLEEVLFPKDRVI